MRQNSLETSSPPATFTMTGYSYSHSPPNGSPTHHMTSPTHNMTSPTSSPYSYPGSHSPYSEPTLTPSSYNVPTMAAHIPAYVEASMYVPMEMASPSAYMPYNATSIKQEYAMMDYGGDPAYYGSPAIPGNYPPSDSVKTGHHISQVKARYTKVAVAGGGRAHMTRHHLPLHENSTVQDINHWLQESVH